jgi:hypothetical protein
VLPDVLCGLNRGSREQTAREDAVCGDRQTQFARGGKNARSCCTTLDKALK